METKDWVTAIITIYGAILSTYLAVMRVHKEKKKLSMSLEYKVFSKKGFLVVANSGHRPITIRRIIIEIPNDTNNREPYNFYYSPVSSKFPNLIGDGETVIYKFGKDLTEKIEDIRYQHRTELIRCKSNISITDGEGTLMERLLYGTGALINLIT